MKLLAGKKSSVAGYCTFLLSIMNFDQLRLYHCNVLLSNTHFKTFLYVKIQINPTKICRFNI